MRLPSADDLFRPTSPPDGEPSVRAVPDVEERPARRPARTEASEETSAQTAGQAAGSPPARKPARRPSGRVRHDEKMTVYVTSEELLDLEHARLSLRRTHGLAVDRGRLVREAVALALADLEENGEDSALVRRLAGE